MTDDITVAIVMPKHLQERINKVAEKNMSNFSQVVRKATAIGLNKMEKQ